MQGPSAPKTCQLRLDVAGHALKGGLRLGERNHAAVDVFPKLLHLMSGTKGVWGARS